jgi:raffinose synthase
MFKIVEEFGKLCLKDEDQVIFPNITICITQQARPSNQLTLKSVTAVSLDHSTTIRPDEAAGMRYECLFTDDDEISTVSVSFLCHQTYVVCNLDARLHSDSTIKGYRFFHATESVMLKVGALEEVTGLMATYQHKDWWTRPTFERDVRNLPPRTQTLLFERGSAAAPHYYYLLPVCDEVFRAEMYGDEQGLVLTHAAYNGGHTECQTVSFVLGTDANPFQLVEETTNHAVNQLQSPVQLRSDKVYPEILEYLGWCSWDAFYHKVNAEGLMDKAEEFAAKRLPVKWFMIDDGWLDVRDERLHAFTADKEKFPDGLGIVTDRLKQEYGLRFVGVWHTLFGYWGGIDPASRLAADYAPHLFRTNAGRIVPSPDGVNGFGFWQAWHGFLKQQGIDFVKVDGQSGVRNFLEHNRDIGRAARASHTSLEASTSLHFDNQVINCMGMAAENVWHRPYSAVSRNSDDFVPDATGSFKEHALQNVYNSLFHSQFYWGDWDMFWTNHPQGQNNGLLRAVSGGPIYFSDRVGETDAMQLHPLVLHDGRVIRCDGPGLPTLDCLFHDPAKEAVALKVWNTANGVGVVAMFHIYEGKQILNTSIRPSDVPGLSGEHFAVLDYFNGTVTVLGPNESLGVSLADEGYALFYVFAIDTQLATPVGLLNKYIAPGTVSRSTRLPNRIMVELQEGGEFGFLSHVDPVSVLVNGQVFPVQKRSPAVEKKTFLANEMSERGAQNRRPTVNLYTVQCKEVQEPVLIEITYSEVSQ